MSCQRAIRHAKLMVRSTGRIDPKSLDHPFLCASMTTTHDSESLAGRSEWRPHLTDPEFQSIIRKWGYSIIGDVAVENMHHLMLCHDPDNY